MPFITAGELIAARRQRLVSVQRGASARAALRGLIGSLIARHELLIGVRGMSVALATPAKAS